jgi:Arc/MetJ-type ribon-helix-helix transcriptional regulator
MSDYTTISIPKDLHEDVEDFIDDTNFTSVAEFTKHLLRDTISGGSIHTDSDLSDDEVEKIRERLENLGYLD